MKRILLAAVLFAVTPAKAEIVYFSTMGCKSIPDAQMWNKIKEADDTRARMKFINEKGATECALIKKDDQVQVIKSLDIPDDYQWRCVRAPGQTECLWLRRIYMMPEARMPE